MKRYSYNGEYWYRDRQSLLGVLLMWFIHIAGWQMPHWTTEGYSYRWYWPTVRRALRGRGGYRSRWRGVYCSMCPITLFGGRITFQSFGVNYWSRRRQAWYCLHYNGEWYRSTNATPWAADRWYAGAPREVIQDAQQQHNEMTAVREERESRERAVRERVAQS